MGGSPARGRGCRLPPLFLVAGTCVSGVSMCLFLAPGGVEVGVEGTKGQEEEEEGGRSSPLVPPRTVRALSPSVAGGTPPVSPPSLFS